MLRSARNTYKRLLLAGRERAIHTRATAESLIFVEAHLLTSLKERQKLTLAFANNCKSRGYEHALQGGDTEIPYNLREAT
jgi:hypothetical protein